MLESRLDLEILPQPDESTCGPTCLHAVYKYFGLTLPLEQVIREVETVEGGGTLDVLLAQHALRRGFRAKIYTYNLQVFDPTWFEGDEESLAIRLRKQLEFKTDPRVRFTSRAYLEYLRLGGSVRFEDLKASLIRRYLNRGIPILTGLSATYLYRTPREYGDKKLEWDDVRGKPSGHFVVLYGYNREDRRVLVADPLGEHPMIGSLKYAVDIDRLVGAILLGVMTYDANLLILEPKKTSGKTAAS